MRGVRFRSILMSLLLLASLPFALGSPDVRYDHRAPWDPSEVAVDPAGNAYMVGYDWVGDFSDMQVKVRKVSPHAEVLWERTFGGTDLDGAVAATVDASGRVFVTGFTWSDDFPTTSGAFQRTLRGGYDSWIARLDPADGDILWSTYFGGERADNIHDIDWGPSGTIGIGGFTNSCDFPTTSRAYDRSENEPCGSNSDAFVARVKADGSGLIFSTYLGGTAFEAVTAVAVSRSSGTVTVAGVTGSADFPTTSGAFQRTLKGSQDLFITKVSASGGSLSFSTLLGGSDVEDVLGLVRDPAGNAFVAGYTYSDDLPTTPGAFQTRFGGGLMCSYEDRDGAWVEEACADGFVARIRDGGGALDYLTYIGTESHEMATGIAIDSTGTAYVTGQTNSTVFPIIDDETGVTGDEYTTFTIAVAPNGKNLAYSQRLWGGRFATGVAATSTGESYHAGNAFAESEPGYLTRLGAPTQGLLLAPRGGNEFWVETFVGGSKAGLVTRVEARDDDTDWTTLDKSPWGFYADEVHVDEGPLRLRATASDGTSVMACYEWPSATPAECPHEPAPTVSFTHGGGNEWWVKAKVSPHPSSVEAMDTGGSWVRLSFRSWGEWAGSFHIEPGNRVTFRASYPDGSTVESCSFTHPEGIAGDEDQTRTCTGSGGGTEPEPEPGTFGATFENVRGNTWWIQTDVTVTDGTLSGVDARVNGGSWIALDKKSWGSWAKSIHAPSGSVVEFRARASDGQTDVSSTYTWPPS